ncbi:TPA: transporter, partial [Streptococcus pneumoniae]
MSNRLVNTRRNIVWGTLNKLIAIALPFLVRTTLIYQLGIQYVGISGLFASILQVLSLADLGFANAIVYSMYKPLAHGDNDTVGALLGFYKKIYRVVGVVILIAGLLIVPFINYLVKGSYPADINIQLIYLIYLANTVVSYFLFAYKRSLLLASQRKDIFDNIDSVARIILSGLQILLLFLFPDFYVFALVIPCMT